MSNLTSRAASHVYCDLADQCIMKNGWLFRNLYRPKGLVNAVFITRRFSPFRPVPAASRGALRFETA